MSLGKHLYRSLFQKIAILDIKLSGSFSFNLEHGEKADDLTQCM